MVRTRAAAALGLALVLVAASPAPATSQGEQVAWEQVRAALDAVPSTPSAAHDEPAAAGPVTVSVTIPDLSWAIDDPTASPGVRRAACHQVTGLDDEKATPLAACLAHVARPPAPAPSDDRCQRRPAPCPGGRRGEHPDHGRGAVQRPVQHPGHGVVERHPDRHHVGFLVVPGEAFRQWDR